MSSLLKFILIFCLLTILRRNISSRKGNKVLITNGDLSGESFPSGQLTKTQIPASVRTSGVAVVGRLQNKHDGGLTDGFVGSVSGLALRPDVIDEVEARDFTRVCEKLLNSDMLSMSAVEELTRGWQVSAGVSQSATTLRDLCQKKVLFMLPGTYSHEEAVDFCGSVGGSLPGDGDAGVLQTSLKDFVAPCLNPFGSWLWLGSYKLYSEGVWTLVTRDVQNDSLKLCRSLHPTEEKAVDLPCEEAVCVACQTPRHPVLTLRLGCEEIHDRIFYYMFKNSGPPELMNPFGSAIVWDDDHWVLRDVEGTPWFYTEGSDSGEPILPLGTHAWEKEDIDLECPDRTRILLSICDPDHFACGDGLTCLAPSSLCDQVADCSDGSDEQDCTPPPAWEGDPALPPPPLSLNDTTSVRLLFTSFSLEAFEPTSFAMEARLSLELLWNDPRVTFHNLAEGETLVPPQAGMWAPRLEGMWAPSAVTRVDQVGQASLRAVRGQYEPDVNLFSQGQYFPSS